MSCSTQLFWPCGPAALAAIRGGLVALLAVHCGMRMRALYLPPPPTTHSSLHTHMHTQN